MNAFVNAVLLIWIPPAIAAGALMIGLGAIFVPYASSKMYGAPTKDTAFVKASGVRDLYIAVVIFELWREHEIRLMALSFFALAFVSLGDGFTTWTSGDRKRSPAHVAGALLLAIYATLVLKS